jgi:2-polyprenyl-3-methyl-5-hydroxy-6-metoxy-1,4-benzoquinol methylase
MADEVVDEAFFARRKAARERLDQMNPHLKSGGDEADPQRGKWFSKIYDLAAGDLASIPWARLEPHPLLSGWLRNKDSLSGVRALDVGCGLGDNAEALAAAGANVTAFDYVQQAVEWASRRFPESSVDYCVANLFEPLEKWAGAFDLVHECQTLQALNPELLPAAARALASFLAPCGELLVTSAARGEDDEIVTSWRPLTRDEIESLAVGGLRLEKLEDITPDGFTPRYWRAEFRRG